MKIGSLFQIMFYNLHNGYKRTPRHIMNSVEIYERCKSKELITSFNISGLCISYTSMKNHRSDLAKFAVAQSSENGLPLPSHFSSNMFTISAFDNFDHSGKNIYWESQVVMTLLSLCFKKFLYRKKVNHLEAK